MIMQWKKQNTGDYIAKWQGMSLLLTQDKKSKKWTATASSSSGTEALPGKWHTAIAAMDSIDAMQQKIIRDKIAEQRKETAVGN